MLFYEYEKKLWMEGKETCTFKTDNCKINHLLCFKYFWKYLSSYSQTSRPESHVGYRFTVERRHLTNLTFSLWFFDKIQIFW